MANATLARIMDGFTDILRLDRTPESVARGWSALNAAPTAEVARAMIAHRVAPVLFSVLRDAGFLEREDASSLTRLLESHYALSECRLDIARRLLADCLQWFNDAGIQPLLMRGVLLAETLYVDPAARPFCDLDFFVRPDEFPRAKEVLSAFPVVWEGGDAVTFIVRDARDHAGDYMIELHDPSELPFVSVAGFTDDLIGESVSGWKRIADMYNSLVPVSTPYGAARVMSADQSQWHLCRHYTKHWFMGSASLLGLLDIALAVNRDINAKCLTFSCKTVTDRAESNLLYPPLFLASRHLGATVPDKALDAMWRVLSPVVRRRMERENQLVCLSEPDVAPVLRATRQLTRRQRLRLILSRLFPSKDLLRAKGVIGDKASLAAYGRWYRHLWAVHALPVFQSVLRRRSL